VLLALASLVSDKVHSITSVPQRQFHKLQLFKQFLILNGQVNASPTAVLAMLDKALQRLQLQEADTTTSLDLSQLPKLLNTSNPEMPPSSQSVTN
jgi:hypothetical protein